MTRFWYYRKGRTRTIKDVVHHFSNLKKEIQVIFNIKNSMVGDVHLKPLIEIQHLTKTGKPCISILRIKEFSLKEPIVCSKCGQDIREQMIEESRGSK